MSDDRYDAMLAELLLAVEEGRELDREAFLTLHRADETTAHRVLADLANYERLRPSRAAPRPLLVDALKSGDRLGDFEIDGLLASGGMGIVYRARQLSLGGRRVALKVLPVESAGLHGIARFQREALALAGLHHPHLAEVFGFGEERGCLFFAMRLVDGPNLRDVLERRAAQHAQGFRDDADTRFKLVQRIAEVADALAVVHVAELLHRDVKPSNIVLEGAGERAAATLDGSAVLVDFGLVRQIDASAATLTGDSPATPSYAPPEQLLGREVDASADAFSLGVTLHDLLSARLPHERTQASVGLEPIEILEPGVDGDLAAVVAKAIDPEARWRYADAADLRDDLHRWLAGEPVSARKLAPLERARRWMSRHPRVLASAAVTALAAVVLALAVSGLQGFLSAARDARAARAGGDVFALVESLRRIPPGLRWAVLRDRELVALAPRANTLADDDPLAKIYLALNRRDADEALFEAATNLRLEGADADPIARDHLVGALRGTTRRVDDRSQAEALRRAVLITARLFYERPVIDPEYERFAAGLRDELLNLVRRDDLDRDTWLHVLTALSGCGRPEDILPVLDLTLASGQLAEARRVGLRCVERIVRRAHGCGILDQVPIAQVWTRYEPIVRERIDTRDAFDHAHGVALHALNRALFIAIRRLDRQAELSEIVDASWRDAAVAQFGPTDGDWWAELCALQDARMRERLLATPASESNQHSVEELGLMCGLFDDDDLVEHFRRRANAVDPAAWQTEFDRGLRESREELVGIRRDYDPDPNTWLGAGGIDDGELELATERREDLWTAFLQPEALLDLRLGSGKQWHQRLKLQPWAPKAFWIFQLDATRIGRGALAADARACRLENDGYDFLKLGLPGESEVTLEFELSKLGKDSTCALVLRHQLAARDYYPFQGRVELELALNGAVCHGALMVTTVDANSLPIELPAAHLREGRNVLSIRLARTSTTTYRILAAAIVLRRL